MLRNFRRQAKERGIVRLGFNRLFLVVVKVDWLMCLIKALLPGFITLPCSPVNLFVKVF